MRSWVSIQLQLPLLENAKNISIFVKLKKFEEFLFYTSSMIWSFVYRKINFKNGEMA
jgi:hypothetical protein